MRSLRAEQVKVWQTIIDLAVRAGVPEFAHLLAPMQAAGLDETTIASLRRAWEQLIAQQNRRPGGGRSTSGGIWLGYWVPSFHDY